MERIWGALAAFGCLIRPREWVRECCTGAGCKVIPEPLLINSTAVQGVILSSSGCSHMLQGKGSTTYKSGQECETHSW